MNTARLVRELEDWEADSSLYELTPALQVNGDEITHLVVSALIPVDGHHGCMVLAADATGAVTSWDPIARTDSADHADALSLLGYEVRQ